MAAVIEISSDSDSDVMIVGESRSPDSASRPNPRPGRRAWKLTWTCRKDARKRLKRPVEDYIDLTRDDNEGDGYVHHDEGNIHIDTVNGNRRKDYVQSSENYIIPESNEHVSNGTGECPPVDCKSGWMGAKNEPDLSEPPVLTVEITTETNPSIPVGGQPSGVEALSELEFVGLDEVQTSRHTAAVPQKSYLSSWSCCSSVYSMAGTSDTSINSDVDSLDTSSSVTILSFSSSVQTADSLEDSLENCVVKTADDSACTNKDTPSAQSVETTPSLLPPGTKETEQDPAPKLSPRLGTQNPALHVLCWLQHKSSNECLPIEHEELESELTSPESRAPVVTSLDCVSPDLSLPKDIPSDLSLPESIPPDLSSPESIIPYLSLPESVPPDLSLPESITPDLSSSESITPDLLLPESITPDLLLPESITPDLLLPESITPDLSLPESVPPDLSLSESITLELSLPESITSDPSSPESITSDLSSPESITFDLSLPESITPDRSLPESITSDLSSSESITFNLSLPESITPDLPLSESIPPDLFLPESIPPDLSLPESIPPDLSLTESNPPEITFINSRVPVLSESAATTTACTYPVPSMQGSVSERLASVKASTSAGSTEASPNHSIDKEMLQSFQYLIGAPIQHIFVNQHRSERGDKELISQRQHNLITSTIDENFSEITLQLLTDFVSPQRYPSNKVVEHVIKKILLGCETHNIVQSAYMVLMKIQQLHPATVSTVQWDWELLAYHMENKEHQKRHLPSSYSQLLFLQYVIQTLDDDFQLRVRHDALHQSIAKAVLSCDERFSNVRSVLKWLIDTITTESEDKDELSDRSGSLPSGSRKVNARIPRIICLLQRMLTLAVEVDRSPTCSSNKIAEALFQDLLCISNRSHRMTLLTSMENRLLRCKLLDILFHHYSKKQSSPPMSLAKILHFLKYAKLSLECEEQCSSKWQHWDEFIHLICQLLLSYQEVTRCHLRYSITDRVKYVLAETPPVLTTHDEITLQDIEFDMEEFHKRVTSDLKAPLNTQLEQQTFLLKALLCDATGM